MIEERARVIAIDNDYACLAVERQTACNRCAVNKGCGTSVLSKVIGKRFTRILVLNKLGAKVGDTVIIAIHDDTVLTGSLMVYLLPLISLLAGALLAEFFFSYEWQTILGALAGLSIGFIAVLFYSRLKQTQQRFQPEMIAIDSNATVHFSGQLLS